jgi:CRP-like cAMP-binding protein
MSGLTFGFTGSYIFSQTIFTYRTGVHSRSIGVLIMGVFFYIVVSPVNILQISPLFFLGSTLIFIGYDLCWEWLWEVRDQVFLSEYGIVWLTFCAIHIVGIDAGIVLGVLIAIVEQIVTTAQTSSVVKVDRRSRAVWTPSDAKILHDYAYSSIGGARIVSLEMHGTVFFGSSLSMLNSVVDELGLNGEDKVLGSPMNANKTPHTASTILTLDRKPSTMSAPAANRPRVPPKYLVLDLTRVTHLDASATRGCFLQLVKMCAKRGIVVCASGATPRIEWMFRSHSVSIDDLDEENAAKAKLLSRRRFTSRPGEMTRDDDSSSPLEQILLFVTVQEALEFCETNLLNRLNKADRSISLSSLDNESSEERSLADILVHMLGSDEDEQEVLKKLDSTRYHEEIVLKSGDYICQRNTYPDSFYVVLSGVVANSTSSESSKKRQNVPVMSGAGLVSNVKRVGSASNLFDAAFKATSADRNVATLWQLGGVFGYNDYLLDKPRGFGALATLDGTRVARISHSHMNLASSEDPALHTVLQKMLLHASTLDLANCTCHDV